MQNNRNNSQMTNLSNFFIDLDEFSWEFASNLNALIQGKTKKQASSKLRKVQGYNKQVRDILFEEQDSDFEEKELELRQDISSPEKLR